jgi:hypothetical protein
MAVLVFQVTNTNTATITVDNNSYTWSQMLTSIVGPFSSSTTGLITTGILQTVTNIPENSNVSLAVTGKGSALFVVSGPFISSNDAAVFTEGTSNVSVQVQTNYSPGTFSYSDSKFTLGAIAPENSIGSVFGRLESLITPDQLRTRHLFGIPLVSKTRDPISGRAMVMTDDLLKDVILRAVSLVEAEGQFDVFPTKYREKHDFDRNAFDSFGYMVAKRRPVSSVDRLTVTPSNGVDVYQVPQAWIEPSNFQRGVINIVPLTIAFTNGGFIPSQSAGGAAFLSILGAKGWIPAYWQIEYTTGFPDGMLPRDLNELIGVVAAIEALSLLATTDADATSRSIGIDAMSQSIGGPGPQKYQTRIEMLMQKKMMLLGKFKAKFALKMFSSHV